VHRRRRRRSLGDLPDPAVHSYPAQNDRVTASTEADAKGCVFRYRPDGHAMLTSASIVTRPKRGDLVQIGNFQFRYRPKAGYVGPDSFLLKVCGSTLEGTGCSTPTYRVDVE
jgi:hypothetical protein